MSNSSSHSKSPKIAPLAFRVGVVGHRPNRLGQANIPQLSEVIKRILDEIKNEVFQFQLENQGLYETAVPILRAISPLAEGTDRIFAEQALDAGYELCCIMPFHEAEFKKDFEPGKALEPDSIKRFQAILSKAEQAQRLTCFELDGNRKDETFAYYHCGKIVLNQSDLLIAVWDGELLGKKGGTEDTMRDALQLGIPILWIDARENHAWQLIANRDEFNFPSAGQRRVPQGLNTIEEVKDVVLNILQLTDANNPQLKKADVKIAGDIERTSLYKFYGKRKPWFTTAIVWKCFRDMVGDCKFPKPSFSIKDFEDAVKDEWPDKESTSIEVMVEKLRPYYAWPDKLAVLYSDRYRSAFILTFSFAAIAVGLALLPLAFGWKPHTWPNNVCIWIEIALMISIIAIVSFGIKNKWHERWIDCRLLAESVRHLRLVAPLGGIRPFMQPQAHHKTYGQPESGWVAWYVRAVERFLGLPSAKIDIDYLKVILDQLSKFVGGQINYHSDNQRRCISIDRKLHKWGLFMLGLTIVACLIHLFMGILPHRFLPVRITPDLMTALCGFLPALGAAMAGINYQGEFKRISKRSKAMCDQLNAMKINADALISDINNPKKITDIQFSVKTSEITGKIARLMTNEVLDWRVVFLDRPLNASV